jgi:hypothetical protein
LLLLLSSILLVPLVQGLLDEWPEPCEFNE